MEDVELIQNILNGNQEAHEILYNKYKLSVELFLRKKYSNYYVFEDYVSEILIKVFVGLKSYDETKSKFSSWVFSIAKNHMIDNWRNESIEMNSFDCSITNPVSFSSGLSTANNIDFETNSSISYIMEQLSPMDYTLLDMKYIQGYNYNEIGSEFNLTSSTISNRVNYIKAKLKKNNPEISY